MFRARCKYCLGRPQYYSFNIYLNHHLHHDWKRAINSNNSWLKTLKHNESDKSNRRSIPMFFAKITSQYKSHKEDDIAENGIIDIASCLCKKTLWMFKLTERQAIKNRKSSKIAPIQLMEIS